MPTCEDCGETFTRLTTLRRHRQTKHSIEERSNVCSECNISFSRRDALKRHQLQHGGNGTEVCQKCDKPFRKDYVRRHQETCQGKRSHPGRSRFRTAAARSRSTTPSAEASTEQEASKNAATSYRLQDPLRILRLDDNMSMSYPETIREQIRQRHIFKDEKDTQELFSIMDRVVKGHAGDVMQAKGSVERFLNNTRKAIQSDDVGRLRRCIESLSPLKLSLGQFDKLISAMHNGTLSCNPSLLKKATALGRHKIAEWLLSEGVDVHLSDLSGTALHQAALQGDVQLIALMLRHGADIEGRDASGDTPLCKAAVGGNMAAIDLLLKNGASVDGAAHLGGYTPLQHVAAGFRADIVERLIDAGADVNLGKWPPLGDALRYGTIEIVELLIEHGASVETIAEKSNTGGIVVDSKDHPLAPNIDLENNTMEKVALVQRFGCAVSPNITYTMMESMSDADRKEMGQGGFGSASGVWAAAA